jgi:hypothetical protein
MRYPHVRQRPPLLSPFLLGIALILPSLQAFLFPPPPPLRPAPAMSSLRLSSAVASSPASPTFSTVVEPAKPKVAPGTDLGPSPVILVVEETEARSELDGGWELILYNDEVNSRHHVARTLTSVCQLTDDRAYEVMMTAHRQGRRVLSS